jgi:hypothetical protein
VVTLTGVRSIDEEQLDTTLRNYKKGAKVGIVWPKSSDGLIALAREAIEKFDQKKFGEEGADYFINNAPKAIRDTLLDREKCERRLPELFAIMADFGEQRGRPDLERYYRVNRADAIKFYLLRANFLAHWKLGYLSAWKGLSELNIHAPDALMPYRCMPSDKFYPMLYDKNETAYGLKSVRLLSIGDYKITGFTGYPDWIYIDLPSVSVDSRSNIIAGEETICRWAIPQVETSGQLNIPPPQSYNGKWDGYVP